MKQIKNMPKIQLNVSGLWDISLCFRPGEDVVVTVESFTNKESDKEYSLKEYLSKYNSSF